MAQITGSGTFTLNGPDSRLYDMEIGCAGFVMDGSRQRIQGNLFTADITVTSGSQECLIIQNVIDAEITLVANNDRTVIVGNYLNPAGTGG